MPVSSPIRSSTAAEIGRSSTTAQVGAGTGGTATARATRRTSGSWPSPPAGGVVGDDAGNAVAGHPRRQRQRRRQVRPGPGGRRQANRRHPSRRHRGHGLGTREAAGRHQGNREERVAGAAAGLLAVERVAHRRGGRRALHVEQDRLRQEAGLLGVRVEPGLHQVAGHVAEQEQAGEQEERDDEQARHQPDEDVGEDQLAAHSPQQPPPRPHRASGDQVAEAEHEREGAGGVDRRQPRRQRIDGPAHHRDHDLDRPGRAAAPCRPACRAASSRALPAVVLRTGNSPSSHGRVDDQRCRRRVGEARRCPRWRER